MATRKTRKAGEKRLAPRGDVTGLARIRMWSGALETAMIQRYIGNAPTLRELGRIVKGALKDIQRIKPTMQSDCPSTLSHLPDCNCLDPVI